MRKPSAAIILSFLLALSWVGFLASKPQAAQDNPPERWSYESTTDFNQLQERGKSGWEAFAVSVDNGNNRTYYMKRRTR